MKEGRFLESKNLFHFCGEVSLKKENPTKFGEFHVATAGFLKINPFQLCRFTAVKRYRWRRSTLDLTILFRCHVHCSGSGERVCAVFLGFFYHGVYIVVHMYICIDTVHI